MKTYVIYTTEEVLSQAFIEANNKEEALARIHEAKFREILSENLSIKIEEKKFP